MHSFTHVYGIDVSKDNLDVLQLSNDASSKEKTQVKNRLKKIESWVKTLCAHSSFCVVEATGTYSSTLIYLLDKYKITVAVVSPFKSKSFMDALGISSKTDDQAAYCLALMGLRLHLKPYQMPSIDRQKRKQVQNAHHAMMKQQRMLKNQLHALDQLPFVETTARNAYEQILQSVELQIQQLYLANSHLVSKILHAEKKLSETKNEKQEAIFREKEALAIYCVRIQNHYEDSIKLLRQQNNQLAQQLKDNKETFETEIIKQRNEMQTMRKIIQENQPEGN